MSVLSFFHKEQFTVAFLMGNHNSSDYHIYTTRSKLKLYLLPMKKLNIPSELFPQDTSNQKCGCYLKKTNSLSIHRPMLPLNHIDYQINISNSLANISLSQRYYNPSDKFLEVEYSFPISPNASIYKFYVEFADVRIEGIVKEKQEAKKQFEKAKQEGRQAAIGTIDPISKDVMNLEIGNIPPNTEFTLYISFIQEMHVSMNTFYRIQIPSTISPRYASNYFDMLEKDKQSNKKKVEGNFTWSFKIELRTTRKTIFFDSPSHQINLLSQNETGTQTLLAMAQATAPNKDFVFLYTTEDFHLPNYVLGTTDVSSTVMLSFIPKFCSLNIDDAYRASIENKSFDTDINTAKGDYIFLLDRSGSMNGTRIQKAKEALIIFLKSLPEDSYFNVVCFGSSSQQMFAQSKKYEKSILEQAIKRIRLMPANLGGTKIYQPLNTILQQKVNKGYPKHVFLLTDGGVSNTERVLGLVKQNTKYCRVHSIGIGNGASFQLIEGSAKNGKGKFIFIGDSQNPSDKIIELLEATLTPLISQIKLNYDEGLVSSIVPNPKSLPYILKDDPINFYVTFNKRLTDKTIFSFEYSDSVSKMPYKSEIKIDPEQLNEPYVDKMGHLQVVKNLEEAANSGMRLEDRMHYAKVKDYKKEAINQSVKHQVLSEFTALLCIHKRLIDGKYEEFAEKGVSKVEISQPKPIQYNTDSKKRKQNKNVQNSATNYYVPPISPSFSRKIMNEYKDMKKKSCNIQKPQVLTQNKDMEKSRNKNSFEQFSLKKVSSPPLNKQKYQFKEIEKGEPHHTVLPNLRKRQQQSKLYSKKRVETNILESEPKTIITKEIQGVIEEQNLNGSWSNMSLIKKLSKDHRKVFELLKQFDTEIVITYVVKSWIEKYHRQKQYSLIIKKAQSWLNRAIVRVEQWEKLRKINKYI